MGGWARDPSNGGGGDETLTELLGLQVWATLVPDAVNGLNFPGSGLSVFPVTVMDTLSFGYLVAPVALPDPTPEPVPTSVPLAMLLAGFSGLVLLRRRLTRST